MATDLSKAGGTERALSVWSNYLSSRGYEITLIDESNGKLFFPFPENSKRIHLRFEPERSVKREPWLVLKRVWRTFQHLKLLPPSTVVMTKSVHLSVFPWIKFIPSMRKHRFVYYSHTSTKQIQTRYPEFLLKMLVGSIDAFICLYNDDPQLPSWISRKLILLPNPSPFSSAKPNAENNFRVLYFGRFAEEKGLELLLGAWAEIEKDFDLSAWTLRLVGEGPDEKSLQELGKRLNLKRIEWAPATAHAETEYSAASVLVLTSHYEGLPMVLIEGLSFGLPIVSTDHTGAQQILTGPLAQAIVPRRDPTDFANMLSNILKSKEKMDFLSRASLLRSRDFAPDSMAPIWKEILNEKP